MRFIGIVLFYLTWPALYVISARTLRVRVQIVNNNKVLLVRNLYGPGIWQLPGGGLKKKEQPIDAAIREIKEELGFELNENLLQLTSEAVEHYVKGLRFRYIIYQANLSTKPNISKSSEIQSYQWFEKGSDEIPSYIEE